MKRVLLGLMLGVLAGCAPTRLLGPPQVEVPQQVGRVTVVLEPFFENTEWQTSTRQEQAQVTLAGGQPGSVMLQREVRHKPLLAQPQVLAEEYRQVLAEVQRLRPHWRVVTTGTLPVVDGPVVLVRTVIGETEMMHTNRPLKTVAAALGFLLVPLLYAVPPVEETQRTVGALYRYEADAGALRQRMLRYPTQPDFAVDTRGLAARAQPFGLDVAYEEGVLAGDRTRPAVLVEGFARQLATAVVAVVEGVR